MPTFSRSLLSASVNGKPIPVAAIATPGTLLHTAVAGTNAWDEVYLFASNVTAGTAKLTIQWGDVTDPGSHLVKQFSIPAFSPPYPIATGQNLNGGVPVRAFADVANAINITGYVNNLA